MPRADHTDTRRYYDVHGMAAYLGITEKALRARVARHQIPFRQWGRSIVFDVAEIDRFIERLQGPTVQQAVRNTFSEEKDPDFELEDHT